MKEYTITKKLKIIEKMLTSLKNEDSKAYLLLHHLCFRFNQAAGITCNGASMDYMEIAFPELFFVIDSRQRKRHSMWAWKQGDAKIRIKFLTEFYKQLKDKNTWKLQKL